MSFGAINTWFYGKNSYWTSIKISSMLDCLSQGYHNIVLSVNVPILDQLLQSGKVMDM